jgi:hypothetical protein
MNIVFLYFPFFGVGGRGFCSLINKSTRTNSPPVHNDFHQADGLFPLFHGLQVKDIDETFEPYIQLTNGHLIGGEIGLPNTPELNIIRSVF